MGRYLYGVRLITQTLVGTVITVMPVLSTGQSATDLPPGNFRITNGTVDAGTHTGWRLFHSACHGCHGVDATGTDLAPNLLEAVRRMTPRVFAIKVMTSYGFGTRAGNSVAEQREALREAQLAEILRRKRNKRNEIVMPAWGSDQRVKPHVLDIFAYLSARADGKLGTGEPRISK